MAATRDIVVGVDGSQYGDAAIDFAVKNLVHGANERLHLVFAYTPLDSYVDLDDMGLIYAPSQADKDKAIEQARDILTRATKRCLGDTPEIQVETHIIAGDARVAIGELAEKLHATAVVVGCHGRAALARAVLGSTSTWLSHHCSRPVVIVRPEEEQAAESGADKSS
ncbi:uncharacterized protein MONBRDRAFT_36320 [Monosiga brevicollis MX1]|uniref:UspA domain-containing protein n=1 Tax=Monosiga brevicollis TaxID=81824 RepID=A9UUW9_MONBE|nr:uncharacterized protein MONBRDRAFT_36320 [Monosiga brevicollis MX1]EDQ90790.1 predicted protein [Monosiga brevicollis MX1]|eukprot:XP_001744087.1 hypothetical protein [Monosiga brevicollis MX1]